MNCRVYTLCIATICGLLVLMQVVSCTDTSTPVVTEDSISFHPLSSVIHLTLTEEQTFSIEITNPAAADITFALDGVPIGTGHEYQFSSDTIGVYTLEATVVVPSLDPQLKVWEIRVTPDYSEHPPTITGVMIDHGSTAGSVEVIWSKPADSNIISPLTHYLIGCSYEGVIGDTNWAAVTVLDSVAYTSTLQYSAEYTIGDDDLEAGRIAWFTVRGLDEQGRMSIACENVSLRISIPYMLEGFVCDDVGTKLPNVNVKTGIECEVCRDQTDADGWFSLGPFPDHQKYVLTTYSRNEHSRPGAIDAYYDVKTDSLGSDDDKSPLTLYLLTRYGLTSECTGDPYDGHFLTFLRSMTYTDQLLNDRDNFDLLKWDHYPLDVFISNSMSEDGAISLVGPARDAIEHWNTAMDETYFFEINDSTSADIVIKFDADLANWLSGQANVVEPMGGQINHVIPRKIHVRVQPALSNYIMTIEVIMHELGHALGASNHSLCGEGVHLMDSAPYGMLANPSPVHIDEQRLMRCIRSLPQRTSMEMFILE